MHEWLKTNKAYTMSVYWSTKETIHIYTTYMNYIIITDFDIVYFLKYSVLLRINLATMTNKQEKFVKYVCPPFPPMATS